MYIGLLYETEVMLCYIWCTLIVILVKGAFNFARLIGRKPATNTRNFRGATSFRQ